MIAQDVKAKHKELKGKVNEVEQVRNNDRSSYSWLQLRELKKQKLKAKDKLYALKSKLHA